MLARRGAISNETSCHHLLVPSPYCHMSGLCKTPIAQELWMFTEHTADVLTATYTYHSFCRCFIDDETFLFLHGVCYRVSGIFPLCMTLMWPFNAIKLLWSGKYKRTLYFIYITKFDVANVQRVGIAPVVGRQDSPHERTFPNPPHLGLQNVLTLRSPTFSPIGTAKWPRPETDREVTNVCSYNCWRYLSGVT